MRERLGWFLLAVGFLLVIVVLGLPQSMFGATPPKGPRVQLDTSKAAPREVEDQTKDGIARDYGKAWQALEQALGQAPKQAPKQALRQPPEQALSPAPKPGQTTRLVPGQSAGLSGAPRPEAGTKNDGQSALEFRRSGRGESVRLRCRVLLGPRLVGRPGFRHPWAGLLPRA